MPSDTANVGFDPQRGGKTRVVRVAVAGRDGRPIVVVNDPVAQHGGRATPFPTLYWLVCPELVRAVSQLEHAGVIAEAQRQVDADVDLRRRLADDHSRYIDQRRGLIDVRRHRAIGEQLQQRGIAGMRNFAAVKCLHAHYAQHLADFNAIGAWLERRGLIERRDVIIHAP